MAQVPLVTAFRLEELIALARAGSPFYGRLYAGLPDAPALADLPILDQASFWEAHHRDPRDVLTEDLHDGVVLNSGGSTGAPKFSYFHDDEWDSGVALEGRAIEGTGLRDGDRVANLFGSGYLYSSFVLLMEALKATPAKVLQIPIGYFAAIPDATRFIRNFKVNVLAGPPTHLMNLVDYFEKEGITDIRLDRILFAGEPFTLEQRRFLGSRYPGIEIRSLGYGTVDGGIIGFASPDCGPGEHRVFDEAAILEIVDEETGETIDEAGAPGRIVLTNLTRRLMPMLRYPTGDRGQWVEGAGGKDRKFVLLGRSEEAARIASFNVPVAEVAAFLEPFRERLEIRQFQLLITQEERRDKLTIRLVSRAAREIQQGGEGEILSAFAKQKPVIAEMVTRGIINPVAIEWIEPEQMEVNARTGKARMVIDRRIV